jgi:UDP-3-O-[3-hydroxymyristoyl] glucosamine N-acyltransferase
MAGHDHRPEGLAVATVQGGDGRPSQRDEGSSFVTLKLGELALRLGAELRGDPDLEVDRVATLTGAAPGSVTFLANRRYRSFLRGTQASAVLVEPQFADECPTAAIVTDNPYLGYARTTAWLNPQPIGPAGIHPTAWVSEDAEVDASAAVGAQSVVEAGARVGARARIGAGCVIGPDAVVGDDSRLVAQVMLCHGVAIGRRAVIHPGAVIGADGFGIANDGEVWVKVPQVGGVRIGDDVEIGANTTIDRGALEDTVIEDGVKLDNLIQIGHNVHIGAHTAIAACVAIGGSARIGRRCAIGGAASLAGHLEIADDVQLTATSAVPSSIGEPGIYSSGMPAMENRAWRKMIIRMRQLEDMARRLRRLERGSR